MFLIRNCGKNELLLFSFVAMAYFKRAASIFYAFTIFRLLKYTFWYGTLVRLVCTFQLRINVSVPVLQEVLRTVPAYRIFCPKWICTVT